MPMPPTSRSHGVRVPVLVGLAVLVVSAIVLGAYGNWRAVAPR